MPEQNTSQLVAVGKILAPWGVKGWFKVKSYSSHADTLFATDTWLLRKRDGLRGREQSATIAIDTIKDHAKGIVAKAEGVNDRNAAEEWKGWEILVQRDAFPQPEEGEYYWVDLIGLQVVNLQGEYLGTVTGLLETGAHDVLVLNSEDSDKNASRERMIPFADAYVQTVDMQTRTITADWQTDY